MRILMVSLVVFLVLAWAQLGNERSFELDTETEGAELALVHLNVPLGTFSLAGGADSLFNATLSTNVENIEPLVNYRVSEGQGKLELGYQSNTLENVVSFFENLFNAKGVSFSLDATLNSNLPLDLTIDLGAVQSNLDLSSFKLTGVKLNAPSGETVLDLRGNYTRSFTVVISKGIGDLRLQLPEDIGVRVRLEGGRFASINALNMTRDGNSYTRGDFFTADVFVDIIVSQNFGNISLE
jgi:hypothetical protein